MISGKGKQEDERSGGDKFREVGEVFRAGRFALGAYEILPGDDSDREVAKVSRLAVVEHFAGGLGRHGGQKVNLVWLNAKGNGRAFPRKNVAGNPTVAKAKILKGVGKPASVVCRGEHEDIEVQRETGVAVKGDGMASADGIVNMVVVQQPKEVCHVAGDLWGTGSHVPARCRRVTIRWSESA